MTIMYSGYRSFIGGTTMVVMPAGGCSNASQRCKQIT